MFTNYFKTAIRNLRKNSFFSAINIIGLSIGFSCCLLIGVYIQNELSYDNFEKKGDRIVRTIMEYSFGEGKTKGNFTSTKVGPVFTRHFPEIEAFCRMTENNRIVKYEDKLLDEPRFMLADSSFFQLFSFKLLEGDIRTALNAPNKVILTSSAARKYFGSTDPVGKTIYVGSEATPQEITGVIQDCPSNSQIKFDFLGSFLSLGDNIQEESYWDANYTTYFLLKDKSSLASLQAKIPGFMKQEMASEPNTYVSFELEPFRKIHLYSPYPGFEPNNSITYIYILAAIALLILAIACFTYINLGTAGSIDRAREVGVRKVLGAEKKQIFWQYIGESVFLSVIAMIVSIAVVILTLPYFNQLTAKSLNLSDLFKPVNLIYSLFIILTIGIIAGSYPAMVLSGFKPIRVLKGSFKNTGSGLLVRKSLIVFQFAISAFLVISTFVIQTQLQYIRHKKLGFDKEHVLLLPSDQKVNQLIETIRTEFKKNSNVLAVSHTANDPTLIHSGYSVRSATMAENTQYNVKANVIDEEFVQAAGLEIIAGSNFNKQDIADVVDKKEQKDKIYHFILNESAAKQLGWSARDAIGKKLFLGEQRTGTVKAVVKDFHFESMHSPITPLILFPENWGSVIMVKMSGAQLPETLAYLSATWKKLVTHRPFEYHFMDEHFQQIYTTETRLGKVLNIFAAMAILLACLGLFGLSSFSAQQRIKEIGIRKILGASVWQIVGILSKEFMILALIAFLLAFPIAWWAVNQWLKDFAYRISVQWWIFPVSGIAILLLALITVAFRATKAALANPVKSIRAE